MVLYSTVHENRYPSTKLDRVSTGFSPSCLGSQKKPDQALPPQIPLPRLPKLVLSILVDKLSNFAESRVVTNALFHLLTAQIKGLQCGH